MKTTVAIFSIIFIALSFGCSNGTTAPAIEDPAEMIKIVMFTDYNSIQLYTDSLTIEKIDVNKDTLQLLVSYGGGCKEHQFALYGSSVFPKSNPPQAVIYLSHNGNGDACKVLVTQEIKFNLEP